MPGQVISAEILAFMAALDVREIHGFRPELGFRVFNEAALARAAQATAARAAVAVASRASLPHEASMSTMVADTLAALNSQETAKPTRS